MNEIEFKRYLTCLRPEAVQNIKEGDGAQVSHQQAFDPQCHQSRIHFDCSSAVVERSFSQFNDILSPKHCSLMEKSMPELLFLYYNKL